MPTRVQLRDYIIATVNEPSVTEAEVNLLLNEAQEVVAGEVLLPLLDTSGTVSTSASPLVDLPDNFGRGLYGCQVDGQDKPPVILTSMRQMLDRHPEFAYGTDIGPIEHVCTSGAQLAYYPIPESTVEVTLFYYQPPAPLTGDTEEPVSIPSAYHRKLLANYAIKELWDGIEDGLEGAKVNTTRFEQKFDRALEEFKASITQGQSTPPPPRDRKGWE